MRKRIAIIIALLLAAGAACAMITFDGNQDKYSMVHLYYGVGQARFDFFRSGATPGGQGEGIWAAGTCEMLVDGTTPVVFAYGPPAGEVWAVTGFWMYYIYPMAGGDDEWGDSGAGLANGVLIRYANATETTNLANLQYNRDDIYAELFFYPFVILRGDNSETIDVVIRDNLTIAGMGTTLRFYAYGYRIQ